VPLARAAIAGIALYVAIDVALVFLRPEFGVIHDAESDYGSKGSYAWLMDLDFILRCVLSLAVVQAIRLVSRHSPRLNAGLALLAVWAVSSGALAFFPEDPVGTATHGLAKVHVLLAGIAFLCVILGTRITTRALRRLPSWRPLGRLLMLLSWGAVVPVLLLGQAHLRPHTAGGLYEKLFLGAEPAWLLAAAAWIASARVEAIVSPPTSPG
jgi:hypothetical membrane protein